MNRTKIEWCDYTWNPIVGCSPASEGCENCYAAALSRRFGWPWGSAHFMPERLDEPARVRKPSRVFVCSMGDFGHETVNPAWREVVYKAMWAARQHTYIILTKRPGKWLRTVPAGVWLGVTVESQENIWRWERLKKEGGGRFIRFVSVEPMLGPVSFASDADRPEWVIAGPETGPKARRCEGAWIDALAAESPCFFDKRECWTRREFPKVGWKGES